MSGQRYVVYSQNLELRIIHHFDFAVDAFKSHANHGQYQHLVDHWPFSPTNSLETPTGKNQSSMKVYNDV